MPDPPAALFFRYEIAAQLNSLGIELLYASYKVELA